MINQMIWSESNEGIFSEYPVNPTVVNPGIYQIKFHQRLQKLYIAPISDKFKLPERIYDIDDGFINRIINFFNHSTRNLGVILNGIKGSGKTITSKIICNKSNLPILVISEYDEGLPSLISNINFDCIILIDEYEKIFKDDERGLLLSCMDGAQESKSKILYLLTTNNLYINENLINRPSRIRYIKTYEDLDNNIIREIVNDRLQNKDLLNNVIDTISKMNEITIDLVIEIIKEVNLFNEKPEKFINIFNTNRGDKSFGFNYKISDADNSFVYYKDIQLTSILSPYTKNKHIYTINSEYFCTILSVIDADTFYVKMKNPKYIDDVVDDNDEDIEEYINVKIKCELSHQKHWSFKG